MNGLTRKVLSFIFGRPNLDKFLREIETEEDKQLFTEACKCSSMGAYRAAYIMLWLSCIESLKRKFKTAKRNDPRAEEIVEEINQRENEGESVDLYVLETSKDYGFIKNDIQEQHLRNIYEDRCVFAHPYEKNPAKESLLSAAKKVVDYVLSQRTTLGKPYIDELIEKLAHEHHFLAGDDHAVNNYVGKVIPKISSDYYFYFMENLWEELQKVNNTSNSKIVNRGISFSKKFLSKIKVNFIEEHNFSNVIMESPQIAPFVLVHPSVFPALDGQCQGQVIDILISKSSGRDKKRIDNAEILRKIDKLSEHGKLTTNQLEKFKSRLNEMNHGDLTELELSTEP